MEPSFDWCRHGDTAGVASGPVQVELSARTTMSITIWMEDLHVAGPSPGATDPDGWRQSVNPSQLDLVVRPRRGEENRPGHQTTGGVTTADATEWQGAGPSTYPRANPEPARFWHGCWLGVVGAGFQRG